MNSRMPKPTVITHGPELAPLSHIAPPPTVVNSATEPMIGHGLLWGT